MRVQTKKWQIEANLHDTYFGGKINWFRQKTVLKGELLIWRTKNQARDQGVVQLNDSICFKSVSTLSRIKHHEISICHKYHYEILVKFLFHS